MKWLFWINIVSSIITYIINEDSTVKSLLMIIQISVSILYVILNLVDNNFFWYNAEKGRRLTFIEDGFGIDISEYKTKDYYNNRFPDNMVKLSINAFESIMFSKITAGRMVWKQGVKCGIALFAFLCTILINKDYDLILIISQTVFSAYYIEEFVTLLVYKSRLEVLYNFFYNEFITTGIKSENQKILLLANTIEYETIKAHYKV